MNEHTYTVALIIGLVVGATLGWTFGFFLGFLTGIESEEDDQLADAEEVAGSDAHLPGTTPARAVPV